MEKPVMIIGADTTGKTALEIFQDNDVVVYGFLDDDESLHGQEINNVSILGGTDDDTYNGLIGTKCEGFVALQSNTERETMVRYMVEEKQTMPVNAIHPRAYVSFFSIMGHGNMISANTAVNAEAEIGNHCFLHVNAVIDANAKTGDYVQIGAGSVINAGVTIKKGAFIGSGVTIVSGVTIGEYANVGAGSVVMNDVADEAMVFGVPAEEI